MNLGDRVRLSDSCHSTIIDREAVGEVIDVETGGDGSLYTVAFPHPAFTSRLKCLFVEEQLKVVLPLEDREACGPAPKIVADDILDFHDRLVRAKGVDDLCQI